jgi:haloalkane dehalogenase
LRPRTASTNDIGADAARADPVLTPKAGKRFAEAIGRPEPEVVDHAFHFLQEDAGGAIGHRIAAWLAA